MSSKIRRNSLGDGKYVCAYVAGGEGSDPGVKDVRKLIDISRDDTLCLMWSVVVVVQRKNKESTM